MKRTEQRKRRVAPSPTALILAAAAATIVGLAGCAGTPPITTDSGDSPPEAIATREMVTVNGRDQGVVIRGHDRTAPVVLWLSGGPGGSELGWTRRYLAELEKDVVFVNWDQPGVARSYRAVDWETVTVEDYVNDTIAMSEYLRDRFGTDSIILAGHSWGSIIGLKAIDRRPELFSAYVGVAQQVNARENDLHGYEMVLETARRRDTRGDRRVVERLTELGPPPYPPGDGGHYVYLFQKVHVYSPHPSPEPSAVSMVFPREYTPRDSFNAIRGVINGVTHVYPQLADLDFEDEVRSVAVPVFFFTGRYDETCVQDIAWRYFEQLEAPHKEFVWFEKSGHNVPYQEPERFVREFRARVLAHISHERSSS
jgi:proline iminopeptidase